ncbi:ferredoxin [Actinospongicola halichondriae]|uniref:ferredoxin n=1 Tax=Actinospongicola halichondriae TaxID=3236844 RepID=UPI003D4209AA
MKLKLDNDACQGHGRCFALAPDLFDADDEGFAVLLVEGEIPTAQEADAQLCADNCPEFAITVVDD